MDIVKQKRIKEWTLFSLVGAMALLSNLPENILSTLHVDGSIIMPVLGFLIMLALMLYVRFFIFLLFTLLVVGSNLPDTWADKYGLSREVFMVTLAMLITIYLLNYALKLLPTGLEAKKKPASNPDATTTLIKAVTSNNLSYIKTILTIDFNLDATDDQGMTPLMHASQQGNFKVVEMLLSRGASSLITGPNGRASAIAFKHDFPLVAERLIISEEAEANMEKKDPSQASISDLLSN